VLIPVIHGKPSLFEVISLAIAKNVYCAINFYT
jgi:hypothetical protein